MTMQIEYVLDGSVIHTRQYTTGDVTMVWPPGAIVNFDGVHYKVRFAILEEHALRYHIRNLLDDEKLS